MPRGKFTPEETKIIIANRVNQGENVEEIAKDFGVSKSSIEKWSRKYKSKQRSSVKKRVIPKETPKEASRANPLEAENRGLREENQRLRNLLLDEILRNKMM
jgi:transposase-like protein